MVVLNEAVSGCNVICDDDVDVSCVLVPDVETYDILPRMMSDRTRFAHLNEGQRTELFAVLDEFRVCLSDKPGLCSATEHPKVTYGWVCPKA